MEKLFKLKANGTTVRTEILAALPMHQHINILNFMPDFRLIFTRRDTLSVLKNVTIGMGAFIHISKAYARLVSWGFTSFILNAIFI